MQLGFHRTQSDWVGNQLNTIFHKEFEIYYAKKI